MYNYETEKKRIFTEEGQVMYNKIRDNAKVLLKKSGAAMLGNLISVTTGDTWMMMACVDRMVELGELKEIIYGPHVAGQHRVFVPLNF